MKTKIEETKALLEKVSGRKVALVEAKEDKPKDKKEKETPKEKKVDKATEVAANAAPASVEKTVAGIIPPVAIAQIQAFMDETLADINEGLMELQAMKIDANTIASGDDYYEKAEELQDEIKQIARMATFVKNTIIAKKFDATLLDKIISYKNSAPAPEVPVAVAPII